MTMRIGIRELIRNTNVLDEYDYVEVEDKKTHEYKGLFISPAYVDEVKAFIDKKIAQEKQAEMDVLMQYAGSIEVDEKYENMSSKQLRAERAKRHLDA